MKNLYKVIVMTRENDREHQFERFVSVLNFIDHLKRLDGSFKTMKYQIEDMIQFDFSRSGIRVD